MSVSDQPSDEIHREVSRLVVAGVLDLRDVLGLVVDSLNPVKLVMKSCEANER